MAVNVDVLNVDGGGEGFERVVVETVQRGQQAQVFGDTLRQRLAEGVILDGQRHVVAEHFKSVERVFFVERIPLAATESDDSDELAANFQGQTPLKSSGATLPLELRNTSRWNCLAVPARRQRSGCGHGEGGGGSGKARAVARIPAHRPR